MRRQSSSGRRQIRISVLAGVVAALLVVVAGAGVALTAQTRWTAESVLVVLPSSDLDPAESAAYYETLSRGQIVATFAEVADNLRFEQQAEQILQLSPEQRADVTTTVSVVPDTSVILIQTSAGTAAIAEDVADAATTLASDYLAGLAGPYRTELVQSAQGSASSSGTSPAILLALAIIVAVIAGVAVQQAVYHLLLTLRVSREKKARAAGPADRDDAPADRDDAPADRDDAPADRDDAPAEMKVGVHGS